MSSVADRFARIADRYDRMNRMLSLGLDVAWRRRAMERLAQAMGDCAMRPFGILDIATGTADLALAAARRFPLARVEGVDISAAMLAIGESKIRAVGLADRVSLRAGDALSLPFADGSFDVAMCAFGFRNFPDRRAALAEVARVLVPGGMLLVLEFFRPQNRLAGAATALWLRLASACFVPRRSAEDYSYLRESIGRTCSSGEFSVMAEDVGLRLERNAFFPPACSCLLFRNG